MPIVPAQFHGPQVAIPQFRDRECRTLIDILDMREGPLLKQAWADRMFNKPQDMSMEQKAVFFDLMLRKHYENAQEEEESINTEKEQHPSYIKLNQIRKAASTFTSSAVDSLVCFPVNNFYHTSSD